MDKDSKLITEAYLEARKKFQSPPNAGEPESWYWPRGGKHGRLPLPPHLKQEIDAYLEGDPYVHVDFWRDWVHEFLSSVGFPEAEDYMPEIYAYLKKRKSLVFEEQGKL
jgi:hypothetical protein